MAIAATCPNCETDLRVPDRKAGQQLTCPDCGEAFRVPQLDDGNDSLSDEVEQPETFEDVDTAEGAEVSEVDALDEVVG